MLSVPTYIFLEDGQSVANVSDFRADLRDRLPLPLARLSPQGDLISAASTDGTARLWYVRGDDLLRIANERQVRDFTPEERERYKDLLGD